MKRIDKYTNDEILALLMNSRCGTCDAREHCSETDALNFIGCSEIKGEYLAKEIEMKPRWETIQSNDDWEDIYVEWVKKPKGIGVRNFIDWLKEEVEV